MARDFVRVDPANSQARLLLQFKDLLRQAYELGTRVRAVMRHNYDDSNPQAIVWTDLEALFGLPAGKGQTVFTLVDGSVGAMEGTFQTSAGKDITETVG